LSRHDDDPKGPLQWKKVEELFKRFGDLLHLHIAGQLIKTTGEHPFYVYDKGWIAAAALQPGDLLSSHDGQWVPVDEVFDTGEDDAVYNLRVAEYHTYFVSGDGWGFSVWAHNANPLTCGVAQSQQARENYNAIFGGPRRGTNEQGQVTSRASWRQATTTRELG
jgi:hypothetical protein